MLQDDYILRQIREMVRAVMKMLFNVNAPELTPENQLYEMTCDGDRQNLEIGLIFYYILNAKSDEFLEENNFSREEIMTGIQDLADRYNLSGIAEAFRTDVL